MKEEVKMDEFSSSQNELLRRCKNGDTSALREILKSSDTRPTRLVEVAVHDAPIDMVTMFIDEASIPAQQTVLEAAALSGRDDVVHYVLEKTKPAHFSKELRDYAIAGGVPVWKELIAFEPKCVTQDVGYLGDPIGLAVFQDDLELVKFLLDNEADIERAHHSGRPVLRAAKAIAERQKYRHRHENIELIIDLLVSRGARMEDDVDM